ncbi:hypothetical protein TYRP_020636 [Tyrophagus putrescentiae]|nr:hypothetical protein TYRP_020636 [Tyrophagus putrescentiae]
MQRLLLMMAVLAALSVASLLLGFFYLRQRQMIRIRPEVRAEKVGHRFVEVHGPYIAIKDFIRRDRTSEKTDQPPINPDYQVTLTTTSTPEFLHHLLELTRRWGPAGLLSVAVYVPRDRLPPRVKHHRRPSPLLAGHSPSGRLAPRLRPGPPA